MERSSMGNEGQPKSSALRRLGVFAGIGVSVLAIVWLLRTVEEKEVLRILAGADRFHLCIAVLLTFLSYVVRAWRWPFFFDGKGLSYRDSFRCLIVGFLMNNTLPARMGEFVRAHLGGRATGGSRTIVLATIAGERLADGLMISLLFAVLFTIGARPEELEDGKELFLVALFFLLATVMTVVIIAARHKIFSFISHIEEKFDHKYSAYTLLRVRRFIEGLEPMLRPDRITKIALLSLVVWTIELSVYFEVGQAFRQALSLGTTSLFLTAVNFSSLIPSAPAGVGVIELFATAALAQVGVPRETALAMVATQHMIQFIVVGLPGAFFFFVQLHGHLPVPEEGDEAS